MGCRNETCMNVIVVVVVVLKLGHRFLHILCSDDYNFTDVAGKQCGLK